jgi:hypothetical protein
MQHRARPGRVQLARDGRADSARRSGDEDRAILLVIVGRESKK